MYRGLDLQPDQISAFRQAFGGAADLADMALWDRLEALQPALFSGMLHFWLQKGEGACVASA